MSTCHDQQPPPDPWISEHAGAIRPGVNVLDLACGSGRHGRFFLKKSCRVFFLDRDVQGVNDLSSEANAEVIEYDLENGNPWPFPDRQFDAIVVTNYLYRPLMPHIIEALAPGGILLYKTFEVGNERYGRPTNPDFLLCKNELREVFGEALDVIDCRQQLERHPTRITQAIYAIKPVPGKQSAAR